MSRAEDQWSALAMPPRKPESRKGVRKPVRGSEQALQESIEPIYVSTGSAIADHRRSRSLTQERLSEAAGMSQNQLARIERGMRRVSLAQLESLAAAMQVSLHDLLPANDPGGGVRMPTSVVSAWQRLSATDRRFVAGLADRLAEQRRS